MNDSHAERIRNIALVSYTGAGKTTLVEGILVATGTIPSAGTVETGTTVTDFEPEEHHRKVSINAAVAHCSWGEAAINLVDTPGALSFLGETRTALRAADAVVIVVSAAAGMRTELEKNWHTIGDLGLPAVLFVNDLDKERTAWKPVVEECAEALGFRWVPVSLPIGEGAGLAGVVNLLRMQASVPGETPGREQDGPVPDSMRESVAEARRLLVEGVAEVDDRLVEKYLAEGELSADELAQGLRAGTQRRLFVPVLCGSALRGIGLAPLLEMVATSLPSPVERAASRPVSGTDSTSGAEVTRGASEGDPMSAFVFKTIIDPFAGRLSYVRVLSGVLQGDAMLLNSTRQTKEKAGHVFHILGKKYQQVPALKAGEIGAIGKLKETQTGDTLCDDHHPIVYPALQLSKPVLSFAIEPKSKADVEKVSLGLHKLVEEDPSLEFIRNPDTKEMILSGAGQLHVDVTFEKLRRKYGADVEVHTPKVPYRETIKASAQAQGRYKKQTGGHGMFGDCWLQLDPLPRGQGFVFENKIVGGAIPRNFIPAVEKGVVEAMHEGILAGFPVVDLRVTVYDGSYHVVDSSEMSFKIAASMGFKKAMEEAHAVLLEPTMTVEVSAPDDAVGAVIGDLNSRRGRILGVVAKGHNEVIRAQVPLAEMLKYAPSLNSITGGRGTYTMEFAAYEEVPKEMAGRVIEEHRPGRQAVAH